MEIIKNHNNKNNKKSKSFLVAAMMILSMSAWQARGMIMAPSSIALPFAKAISWGAGKIQDSIVPSMMNYAIEKRNIIALKLLLKVGAREYVNKHDKNGRTPFHEACNKLNFLADLRTDISRDKLEMVRLLLDYVTKESINKPDSNENTPLNLFCFSLNWNHKDSMDFNRDELEMVKLFLEKGAKESVNKQNKGGSTPLYWACRHNNLEVVRLLLDYVSPEVYVSVLSNIISSGLSMNIFKLLIDNGRFDSLNNLDKMLIIGLATDIDCKALNLLIENCELDLESINMKYSNDFIEYSYGATLLHKASCKADCYGLNPVKLLLERGAIESINKLDDNRCTPLHCACESLGIVRLLLENGALESIDMQDSDGNTPIQLTNNEDIRSLLNLVIQMQASPDKVAFIKNLRMERSEDFGFLVKVLRGDLLVQLAKPEARGNELSVVLKSDFYALLVDQRLTQEERIDLNKILELKLEGFLDIYDYMFKYSEKRLPKVYKAMQRLQFQEHVIERCIDCDVVV